MSLSPPACSKSPPMASAPGDSEPAAEPAPLSLADMPLPWLDQLPSKGLSGTDDLALLRTCTFMRDQVLGRRALHVAFQLSSKPEDTTIAQTKLLLAIKYSSNVHLVLEQLVLHQPGAFWTQPQEPQPQLFQMRTAATRALLSDTMAATGHPLDAVRSVNLSGMMLDAVLPSWLGSACPQMDSLALKDCDLTASPASGAGPADSAGQQLDNPADITAAGNIPAASPSGSRLQTLELGHGTIPMHMAFTIPGLVAPPTPTAPDFSAWQHQLNSLTDLTSLTLHVHPDLLSGCPNLLTQLNQLSLPKAFVNDKDMEVLLSMPRLARVTCEGFYLQQSYRQRPCSWTHLQVGFLVVEEFDRLPLEGVTSIQVLRGFIIPSKSLAACTRVAAIIAKCGSFKPTSPKITLAHPRESFSLYDDEYVDNACVAALLPMLAHTTFRTLALDSVAITTKLLAALGQQLADCDLRYVDFMADCAWTPDAWPALLPCLPPVAYIGIKGYLADSDDSDDPDRDTPDHWEENITAMCAAALRPVTVELNLHSDLPEGFKERVLAAMAAAGHQHVELIMEWSTAADDDDGCRK